MEWGGEGGIVTNETRTAFIYFCEFLYEPRGMSGEGAIVTVEMRKNIHTIRADEVASLRYGRLDRKSSELHELRNGKEFKTYLSEKSTIQCLDVKVVRSKYELRRYEVEGDKTSTISVDKKATNKNRRERKREGESRDDVEGTNGACNPPKS